MRFITTLPNLSVCVQPGRQLSNPITGQPGVMIPNKIVTFARGFYETNDRSIICALLRNLRDIAEKRRTPTFGVHPEDLDKVDSFDLSFDPASESPDIIIARLQAQIMEQNATIAALLTKTQKTKTLKGGKVAKEKKELAEAQSA